MILFVWGQVSGLRPYHGEAQIIKGSKVSLPNGKAPIKTNKGRETSLPNGKAWPQRKFQTISL